jgi:hypothetical protein
MAGIEAAQGDAQPRFHRLWNLIIWSHVCKTGRHAWVSIAGITGMEGDVISMQEYSNTSALA